MLARCAVVATLSALATFGFAAPLAAQTESWLTIEGVCPASAAEVARRVDAELIGSRPAGAGARIGIDSAEAGYQVTLRAARAGKALGVKHLVAPSCDEAVDAAVLVLAIALTEPELEIGYADSSAQALPEFVRAAPPALPERDEPARAAAAADNAASDIRRVGMLFGIETGIASQPTPYLGASFAVPVHSWELWSGLRYGLPAEEESVDASSSEQSRRDFGAVGLSLCRGVGAEWRLSACAGGEFGVVRTERVRRDGDVEVDTDEARPRLAGVGTARLAGRVGRVRPELEFSAAAASWGPDTAPHLSLRLGAGVAVQF